MQEGQIVRNKATGQLGRVVNGQVVPINGPQQPAIDPRIDASAAQAQANTQRTQTQTRVDEQTAPTTVQTNQAPAGYMWVDPSDPAQGVTPIPGYTAPSQQEARLEPAKLAQLRALEEQIARVEKLYNAGPAQTRGVAGVQDYFPTDANAQFDAAGASLAEVGLAAFRVPGVGSQSDNELKQFVEANRPSSGDRDVKIQEKINNLKTRLRTTYEAFGVQPQNPSLLGMAEAPQQPTRAAGVDAAEARGEDYSDEYKGSLKDLERQLERGAITAEKYAEGRMAIDRREFGEEAADQTGLYMEEAYQRQRLFGQGITADQLPPPIPPNRQLSEFDQLRNNVAASPFGTGVANFADAGSLGAVSMIAGDRMQAANDLNPGAAMLGQIGGSIGGTAGLGLLGRQATGRLAPMLLRGGGKSQFARNVGTDAAYGTIYGANTGMDVDDAALSSVVGSVGGNVVGNALGTLARGVNVDPAAQYLRNRNIPLTTGQTLGGFAKNIEDAATSIPGVGDMINARRLEGLQAFNREAFNEAGKPIGFASQRIGREGLGDLQGATSRAYDNAVAGRVFPIDSQFNQQIDEALEAAQGLPDDLRQKALLAYQNRVNPLRGTPIYHGTSPSAARAINRDGFDLDKTIDSSAWFTSNPDIGDVGAAQRGAVVRRTINENDTRLAGWDESDRLTTDQLIQEGYSGVKMPSRDETIYRIFNPNELTEYGSLTGERYQQARRGLSGYKAENVKPGFEEDYRNIIGRGQTALDDLVARQGGEDVVQGLNQANQSYRLGKILDNATLDKAKGGSQSGEVFTFTPSQLQAASRSTNKRFPGINPLDELADQGQRVLPSRLPDSGTGRRIIQGSLGALALGGAGAGETALTGDASNTALAGGTLAALMLGGTRGGQRAINALLTERPDLVQKAAEELARNRMYQRFGGIGGIFGSASVPLALESSR